MTKIEINKLVRVVFLEYQKTCDGRFKMYVVRCWERWCGCWIDSSPMPYWMALEKAKEIRASRWLDRKLLKGGVE